MEPSDWLTWARRLQAIAQTGLTYANDTFDRERYTEIQEIATDIISRHSDLPPGMVGRLLDAEAGYATPKVDIRAAVFQDGKVLLVRERSDGGWTLPGGWADVGCPPSKCAVKEALEEAGCNVRPVRLLALLDRDRHGHPPLLFHVYKVFFECELLPGSRFAPNTETDASSFFGAGEIPPLSLTRIMPHQLARLFELHNHPEWPPDFD